MTNSILYVFAYGLQVLDKLTRAVLLMSLNNDKPQRGFVCFILRNPCYCPDYIYEREVVVVDPVPLPANFMKIINTNTRAITTPRGRWLF